MGALSCSCTFPRIECPLECAQACDACHLARSLEPHPIRRGEEKGTTVAGVARGHCDRCDRCGWPFGSELGQCRINDCSMRPLPARRDVCQGCGARFAGSPAPSQPDPDAAVRGPLLAAHAIMRSHGECCSQPLCDQLQQAFAAGRDEGARDERERERLRRTCIWDPYTTGRGNVLCKTCRWPRDRGPFVHVNKGTPDADATTRRSQVPK